MEVEAGGGAEGFLDGCDGAELLLVVCGWVAVEVGGRWF